MCNRGVLICVRHFPCKFPHKMALVTCSCAFRLRRLAQNDVPGIGVPHFSCGFPTQKLFEGASTEILLRDSSWRSFAEILPRDALQRSCQQSASGPTPQTASSETKSSAACCFPFHSFILLLPDHTFRGLLSGYSF